MLKGENQKYVKFTRTVKTWGTYRPPIRQWHAPMLSLFHEKLFRLKCLEKKRDLLF